MGLFSSKSVTQVGTSVSRVIKDDLLPDSAKTGMIKAILNDGSIPDYSMEEMVGSIAVRAERMYAYAKNHYTYGLPSGQRVTKAEGKDKVVKALNAFENTSVSLDYSHIGPPNDLHIGWMTLVSQYGYNTSTNELEALRGSKPAKVYLSDMVVVVPAAKASEYLPGALEQWGIPASAGANELVEATDPSFSKLISPSNVMTDPNATSEYVRVVITWAEEDKDKTKIAKSDYFNIPITGYNSNAEYVHAKYYVQGTTKYFMYQIGSGTNTLLDSITSTEATAVGTYFPFAYFRFNHVADNKDKSSDGYKTSKKLVKYLGMDYDTVADAIDKNPDIKDVEQAMMVFAVPANTKNDVERRYIFDFFDELYSETTYKDSVSYLSSIRDAFEGTVLSKQTSIVIEDKRFKMALTFDGITKRTKKGNIGTYDSGFDTDTSTQKFQEINTDTLVSYNTLIKTHYYRRQITETLYEEIRVSGLKMVYYIFGEYTATGDEEDDVLLIPIDLSISSDYSIPDRELLYARSLHYVFNSKTVTKLKWYQTGLFAALVIIIAIAITIVDAGSDGGSAIGAALGLTGTSAIVATVVINLIIGQVIAIGLSAVYKLFVKAFGTQIANLVAIIAIIYGGYQLAANGVKGAPMAKDMLQVSTGLQKAVLDSKIGDLISDAKSFEEYVKTQTELLEKAEDLLNKTNILSPFVVIGEAPEDFYNRTVHTGNIGVLGFEAISSYVDIALTLPKTNDTLGEIYAV